MKALFLIQSWLRYPSITQLALNPPLISIAQTVVSYFYLVLPYLAFVFFQSRLLLVSKQNLDLAWPLYWTNYIFNDFATVVDVIGFLFLITSLIGILYFRYTFVRIIVFIGFWQAHALQSSFGEVNHQWLGWLGIYFIFIFLPNIWNTTHNSIESNKKFLLVLWWSQAMVMWVYSMAGLAKVLAGLQQMALGEINSFSISAFSYQVADWLPKNQGEALFGPFIIEHPFMGWFLYLGSMYFQVFALWVVVRPSLQRVWAFELILFHIGTTLAMGVSFTPFILLLALLFFNSPFGRDATIRQMLLDLPIVGQCLEWFVRYKNFNGSLMPMGKTLYSWMRVRLRMHFYSIGIGILFGFLLIIGEAVSNYTTPPPLDVVCGNGTTVEKHECWETNLKKIVADHGAPAALYQLRNLFINGDGGPSSYCHTLAHVVGSGAYKEYALHGTFVYSPEMSNCSYGFYHGFIEALLAHMGDYSAVKSFCKQIVVGEDPSRLRNECFHGVGHGVVDRHVPDDWKYPKQILARSLKVCASMKDIESTDSVRNCVDGVYSGIRTVYFFGEYKVELDPEHILDLCKGGPKDYLDICYNYMSTMFFKAAGQDFAEGLRLAITHTDAEYRGVAVGAVAATWATANMFIEPQNTWSACRALPTGLQFSCITGYARGLVQNSKPGSEYIFSLQFCSQESLNDAEADNCFKATQGELQRKYSRKELGDFCKQYAMSQERICIEVLTR